VAARLQEAMQRVGQAALAGFSEEDLEKLVCFFQRMECNILTLCKHSLDLNSKKEDNRLHASDV